MLDALQNLVKPAPSVERSTVMIVALEARVTDAEAAVNAARAAYEAAALADAEGDPKALAKAKQARADALLELDDAQAALAAARARHEKSKAAEAEKSKAEHDRRVRELAERRKAAAEKLHAQAKKYAAAHQAYWTVTAEFADALSVSGTAQRQRSLISGDAVATRVKLDLLTLGVGWAHRVPIAIESIKPFVETICEETDYLTGQACGQ